MRDHRDQSSPEIREGGGRTSALLVHLGQPRPASDEAGESDQLHREEIHAAPRKVHRLFRILNEEFLEVEWHSTRAGREVLGDMTAFFHLNEDRTRSR